VAGAEAAGAGTDGGGERAACRRPKWIPNAAVAAAALLCLERVASSDFVKCGKRNARDFIHPPL